MQKPSGGLLQHVATRIGLFLAMLLLINATAYAMTNFMALRGPMADGYVPDTTVPIGDVFTGYGDYLRGLISGELTADRYVGGSRHELEVMPIIARGLANSLILLALAFAVSSTVGIGLGLISLNPRLRRTNPIALAASVAGFSMPGFYLGILILALLFSMAARGQTWSLLPASGYGLDEHLILPVIALSVRPTAEITRLTAELLREELGKDYVRAARAKGLSWRMAILRHAFRNVVAAVITALGNSLSYLLGSLVIIERVFMWPGLGKALMDAITLNDFAGTVLSPALIATLITTGTLLYLCFDLFADLTSRRLDPRLRRA